MSLFNNSYQSDYHLIDSKGNKLYLHKCILINKLDYFKNLFSGNWKTNDFLKVNDIQIYMPLFEFMYKNIISAYDFNFDQLNELILYSEQILFFEGNEEFLKIIIDMYVKFLENKEEIIFEEIEQSLTILSKYDNREKLNDLMKILLVDKEVEQLKNIFCVESLRKYILDYKKLVNLIIWYYEENKDRSIFNELNLLDDNCDTELEDLCNIIFSNVVIANKLMEYFGSNFKYLINTNISIEKYYPLVIHAKIGIIRKFLNKSDISNLGAFMHETVIKQSKKKKCWKKEDDSKTKKHTKGIKSYEEEFDDTKSPNIFNNKYDYMLINIHSEIHKNDKIILCDYLGDQKIIEIESLHYIINSVLSKECNECYGPSFVLVKLKSFFENINDDYYYDNITVERRVE